MPRHNQRLSVNRNSFTGFYWVLHLAFGLQALGQAFFWGGGDLDVLIGVVVVVVVVVVFNEVNY